MSRKGGHTCFIRLGTLNGPPLLVSLRQGEMYVITEDRLPYHLPCGELCSTTCLDLASPVPTFEVREVLERESVRRFVSGSRRSPVLPRCHYMELDLLAATTRLFPASIL